jgi:hypothetical protein
MHPWAAIHAAIGLENRLHFLGQGSIFSAVPAGRALRGIRSTRSPRPPAPGT